jgi:hypothetical protein
LTTIADVRSAIGTALGTISGLNVKTYLSDQINPPQAQLDFEIPEYHRTMGSDTTIDYLFTVYLFFPRANEESAQVLMDTLRDPNNPSSVKAVLETDTTLAGVVDYVEFRSSGRAEGLTTPGGAQYLIVPLTFEVCF